mmetsp:Transcript_93509/g.286153  ORF Transcript_93509/g.286153 Transcript_93509/m.286153 type:complete len:347 (-) Transcript_93509:518-1558(-)
MRLAPLAFLRRPSALPSRRADSYASTAPFKSPKSRRTSPSCTSNRKPSWLRSVPKRLCLPMTVTSARRAPTRSPLSRSATAVLDSRTAPRGVSMSPALSQTRRASSYAFNAPPTSPSWCLASPISVNSSVTSGARNAAGKLSLCACASASNAKARSAFPNARYALPAFSCNIKTSAAQLPSPRSPIAIASSYVAVAAPRSPAATCALPMFAKRAAPATVSNAQLLSKIARASAYSASAPATSPPSCRARPVAASSAAPSGVRKVAVHSRTRRAWAKASSAASYPSRCLVTAMFFKRSAASTVLLVPKLSSTPRASSQQLSAFSWRPSSLFKTPRATRSCAPSCVSI